MYRELVEPHMEKKNVEIKCQVEKLGKRWSAEDRRLNVTRTYREAHAVCWLVEYEEDS